VRQATIKEHPAVRDSFVVDVEEWKPRRRDWVPVASKEFKLSETRNENFDRALAYAKENMMPNTDLSGGIPSAPNSCSAWIPVESEPVPEGVVCDMVHDGWDRMTNVIYLDDWVYCEDAMHYDPNGDGPDPIELCPIGEITHWAKIVMPNATHDGRAIGRTVDGVVGNVNGGE